jgi:hypothetical protein
VNDFVAAARGRMPSGCGVCGDRLVVGFLVGVIPPIVDSEILPLDLPLHGLVSSVLGVGLAALVVTNRHDRYQGTAGTQRELCPRGGQLASAEAGSCSAL